MNFNTDRNGKGTKEWADHSINVAVGCSHNCRYCYARGMAMRFGRATRDGWATEHLRPEKLALARKKYEGVVMFPTAHDITPATLDLSRTVLRELVARGNQVLIVSKPHVHCVDAVCDDLNGHADQVQFRFTMGTGSRDVAAFWEPGAPEPAERLDALRLAYARGFATSVSMEPMLSSVDDTIRWVRVVDPYVSETIWIGKLNRPETRVMTADKHAAFMLSEIRKQQCDDEILRMVDVLRGNAKIRWKDSIKEVMRSHGVSA